jgi:hypothetical protein
MPLYIQFTINKHKQKVVVICYIMTANSFVQGLNMKALMDSEDYVDNTAKIRELKHSELILEDIAKLCKLKQVYHHMRMTDEERFNIKCQNAVPLLFNSYTDIYNKVLKDELNMELMVKFVCILKQIEEGQLDQYDASVQVGTILREMYVDSAMRRAEKLDTESEKPAFIEPVKMSWAEFKASKKEKKE